MSFEEELNGLKTDCCNAGWYAKNRADFRCKECDEDVTLHVILYGQMLKESEKYNKKGGDSALESWK